jgi:hypothetical protein
MCNPPPAGGLGTRSIARGMECIDAGMDVGTYRTLKRMNTIQSDAEQASDSGAHESMVGSLICDLRASTRPIRR